MPQTPPSSRPTVRTSFRRQSTLSEVEKTAMYAVFEQYYANTKYHVFAADLGQKDSVILFTESRPGSDKIVGFSTLARSRLRLLDGREAILLFSGDTVLQREYWGSRILQLAFFREIVRAKFSSPLTPVYWMLISKGFKTFAMMRRNFAQSYPNPAVATPPIVQDVLQQYYGTKYGAAYNPATDLILLHDDLAPVKGDLAKPTAAALADPEIAFFLKKNPGYSRGDELACTAEIRFRDFPCIIVKYILPKLGLKKTKKLPMQVDEQGDEQIGEAVAVASV